jgi:hypothetical protein
MKKKVGCGKNVKDKFMSDRVTKVYDICGITEIHEMDGKVHKFLCKKCRKQELKEKPKQ